MKINIANEMSKFLEHGQHSKQECRAEELEKAQIPLDLIRSTELLISAAANYEALGKAGEAKFLWKIINTAQTKLRNEINETPPIKKEASVQDSYQKYSNLLKDM